MCGIAGFWGDLARRDEAPVRLERMTDALRHRGPDGQGHWIAGEVALGHTRLAIIDVHTGAQPMRSANQRTAIVFNGEIYNHHALRTRLEALGYVFHTRSDTEVIWAALDAWGVDQGLLSLRGMFAFALYNLDTRRLLLARDRVGIKPLYWAEVPGGIVFGSEQKALLMSGVLSRRMNPVAVHDYLGHGYPTTPSTCWRDIRMLEPGSWVAVGPDGITRGRYWQWTPREDTTLDIETATELTRRTLLDAARAHLLADVPVGAFLSGGLDSSLLVSLLSPQFRPGLPTFNVGFGDPEYDESDAARLVASRSGTDHHELRLESQQGTPDVFREILDQYDEPFGDSSCIPVYLICREMRQHVKVVLSGDGGDEVLGGYPRYLYARRLASLARLNGALPPFNSFMRFARDRFGTTGRQADKAWRFAQMPGPARLAALQTYFSEDERQVMYLPEFARAALGDGPTWARLARFIPDDLTDPAQQLMTAELRLRLHADYLRKVDVASAAHGIEVRVPYLDNEMLDLAARLPMQFKISKRGESKILARRLARQLLPPAVAAKRKMGFSIPLDRWMGPDMRYFVRSLLLDPGAEIARVLRPELVTRVWTEFENQTHTGGLSRYQRYQRLFLLTSLELWLQRWKPSLA